jgi:hypothetical protein
MSTYGSIYVYLTSHIYMILFIMITAALRKSIASFIYIMILIGFTTQTSTFIDSFMQIRTI